MKHHSTSKPYRKRGPKRGPKRNPIVSFARSVTILSLISCIASVLFLELGLRGMYLSRYGFFIALNPGMSLVDIIVTIIVNLRHCVWVGLLLAPIVGYLYTQTKLSSHQAKRILGIIKIVESVYLLFSLCAAVCIGWIFWAWRNW